MTDLGSLIHYWESVQNEFAYLMGPATQFLIKKTIKYLKQLQDKQR